MFFTLKNVRADKLVRNDIVVFGGKPMRVFYIEKLLGRPTVQLSFEAMIDGRLRFCADMNVPPDTKFKVHRFKK